MTKFINGDWIRTCQECGHKQKAKKPDTNKELTNSYIYSRCKRCKSEALDYGKHYYAESQDLE